MEQIRLTTITVLAAGIIVLIGVTFAVQSALYDPSPMDTSITDSLSFDSTYAWQQDLECTEDLKACADGSYVGRSKELGCAFDACPQATDFKTASDLCGNGICDVGEDINDVCSPPVCEKVAGSLKCKPIPTFAPNCSRADLADLCPQDCQVKLNTLAEVTKSVCGNSICEQGEATVADCPACNNPDSRFCSHRACILQEGSCNQDCAGVNIDPIGTAGCAQDVFVCPDGTSVGRTGDQCQFACPVISGCKADYDGSGVVSIADLSTFIANYKKQDINCSLDVDGDDCALNLNDLQALARVYKKQGVCAQRP